MRSIRAAVATAGFLLLGAGAGTAWAAPIPFAVFTTDVQPGLSIAVGSDYSLSSADQPNPAAPLDPVYGMSAPLVISQLLPAGGIEPGYLKMDPLALLAVLPPATPVDPVGLVYGAGTFSIALLDLAGPSLIPWLDASFDSLVVFLYLDVTGFAITPGAITFSGLSFGISGLQNPGTAFLELRPVFDATGAFNGQMTIASGVLAAESVPEPSTLLLVAGALPALALARKRLRRRRARLD